jgi:hypothetical protein
VIKRSGFLMEPKFMVRDAALLFFALTPISCALSAMFAKPHYVKTAKLQGARTANNNSPHDPIDMWPPVLYGYGALGPTVSVSAGNGVYIPLYTGDR